MYRVSTLLLLLCSYSSLAQQTVSGVVKDKAEPVVAATVSLLNATDSSWVRSELTDDKGAFIFQNIEQGRYLLDIQAIGYSNTKTTFVVADKPVQLDLSVARQSTSLSQVTVNASKPLIEAGPGKLVVNVESTIRSTGTNAFDLLRKSPGVTIDDEGNITLQGRQGVTVLINDRPTYLSGRQLAAYLRSLPSEDLAKLELITQPTAKYDAEGSAGLINIVQKKNKKYGFNGAATIAPGMGVYPNTHNNLNLTWKKNKVNAYMNASYMKATGFLRSWLDRDLLDENGKLVTNVKRETFMKEVFSDVLVRTGMDYDWNDKTTVGILMSGNYHPNTEFDEMKDHIVDVANGKDFYNYARHETGFLRKRIAGNVYMKNKFNDRHSITTNCDYTKTHSKNREYLNNLIHDAAHNPLPGGLLIRSVLPKQIDAYSVNSDYTGEFSKTMKIEAGVKSAYAITDFDAKFDIYVNDEWINDTGRTNHFVYKENINAAYVSLNKELDSTWKFQAGLRAEQWNISGDQRMTNEYFERSALSLFPTAFVSCKLNAKNQLQLNYGRRIRRPSYNNLNPFPEYLSQFHYEVGNPMLLPQMTHNIELTHVYDGKFTGRAYCTRATNVMNGVVQKDPNRPNVTFNRGENIAEENTVGMSVTAYNKLLQWWEMSVMGWGYYSDYYDNITKANRFGSGYGVDIDSQFTFKDGWRAETHVGFMGRRQEGIYAVAEPAVYTSAGVSKRVLKDSGSVTLRMEDPFFMYLYNWSVDTGPVQATGTIRHNTMNFNLGFTYNFGRETSGRQRERSTDEARRM